MSAVEKDASLFRSNPDKIPPSIPAGPLLFVYGSLMSWRGLSSEYGRAATNPSLRVISAEVATCVEVARGLWKWSSGRRCWTMNLSRAPQRLAPSGYSGVSGLLLTLEATSSQLEKVRAREGWPRKLWEALKLSAPKNSSEGGEVPYVLSTLRLTSSGPPLLREWARACRGEQVGALETLREVVQDQLLPVPIPVGDGRVALTSWAPFSQPAIEEKPAYGRRRPNPESQREYLLQCALGKFHGVDIRDLMQSLLTYGVDDAKLAEYETEEWSTGSPFHALHGSS